MLRLFPLALLFALVPLASAQDADSLLTEGAHALQFQIAPDLDLDGTAGTVGIKWHRSETAATHLALTVGGVANVSRSSGQPARDSQSVSATVTLIPTRDRRSRTPV